MRINRMLSAFFVGMVMALVLAVPVQANESLLSYLTTGGGSGIPTLQKGQQSFSSSGSGYNLIVNVDYAVFAPGTYNLGFSSLPNFLNPTANYVLKSTDYVYAYQMHNLAGSVFVSSFTMPHVPQINFSEYSFGYSGPAAGFFTGDVNPSLFFVNGSSAIQMVFFKSPNLLPPEESSYVFLVATPHYSPGNFRPVSVADHGLSSQENMPVPVVPVPGALTLAAMGMSAVLFGRVRRRFV
jgi:hypothetical protein